IAFKVSTRQIVEQHLELRIEEIAPAFLQMTKERRLVREQMVMHIVEPMAFSQSEIAAEQVGHRALLIPLAMKTPFAARINQAIAQQGPEKQHPRRALPPGGHLPGPDPVGPSLR